MTWDDVVQLLSGVPMAHLATAGAGGGPHVAKVSPGIEGDLVWVATTVGSGKATDLRANPRVALMWEGNRAETYLWGDVVLVTDADEKARVWHGGVFGFDLSGFFGSPDNPDLVMARITPARVTAMVAGESGLDRRTWRR